MFKSTSLSAKKQKTSQPSTGPVSPDDYRPQSPEAYAPESPTASTSALPELEGEESEVVEDSTWDASWVEGAGEIEYEDDWEEEPYGGVAAATPIQLDFGGGKGGKNGHWDDGDLVRGWEREKKQWEVSQASCCPVRSRAWDESLSADFLSQLLPLPGQAWQGEVMARPSDGRCSCSCRRCLCAHPTTCRPPSARPSARQDRPSQPRTLRTCDSRACCCACGARRAQLRLSSKARKPEQM